MKTSTLAYRFEARRPGPAGPAGARIAGGADDHSGPGPDVMGARTLAGDTVVNPAGEKLGTIVELMLDVRGGRIAYAVLSCGGVLGFGDKLFAIPWGALTLDARHRCFVLNVDREALRSAPGFDKHHWPSMADERWAADVHAFYSTRPYWS